MASSCGKKKPRVPIIASVVPFLLLLVSFSLVSATHGGNGTRTQALFGARDELRAYRRVMARAARMKMASVKTIQSPDDGDAIDCVPSHLQPAFDHPKLRGQKPEDEPAERPRGSAAAAAQDQEEAVFFPQAWSDGGESCPEGTVPVRRTTERDVLRCSSARRFGMKPRASNVRRDSTSSGHEHAVGYVTGDQFYGAKASLNVWSAKVASAAEFSLSQIWVISGSFGNDLNTIEAGWQVSPELYGDNNPRFFTYWTSDAYQETGCYNLYCSGFVQTNNRIAIGAAISPTSVYNGRQFDISLLIWKDPRRGHWWLQLGSGPLVGYWPSFLFTHLGGHANMVQFGGEVVNSRPSGSHTPTQMGSGHFPREGFNRAAYFRNVQVVDWDNSLVPAAALRLVADHPGCYDIQGGYNRAWGNYFYYGGPGRNVHCP
ncbi:protein neprosin-like [Phragmites australis]|uniref:protein neprosin-like n=1 Tax=Phragmites australis TaxID=29695 RepID=UPI002D77C1C8|nr:protein neprosin-like [Phragmites australis]